jgi:hypothetical protein
MYGSVDTNPAAEVTVQHTHHNHQRPNIKKDDASSNFSGALEYLLDLLHP